MILFEVLSQIFDEEHNDDRHTQYRAGRGMAEQLSQASPDLLRQMVQIFAEALMSDLPQAVPLATVLTMVEFDPADPAFRNPTKFRTDLHPGVTEAELKQVIIHLAFYGE